MQIGDFLETGGLSSDVPNACMSSIVREQRLGGRSLVDALVQPRVAPFPIMLNSKVVNWLLSSGD